MTLPPWLAFGPHWLLPALEIGLLSALVASGPGRLERRSAALRAGGLVLAGLLSLTNATFAECSPPSRAFTVSLTMPNGKPWEK
jgi:hypothetical protein